jgi:hypothetical protein
MESFFSSLKHELTHHKRFATHDEAKRRLFDNIKVFYNAKGCTAVLATERQLSKIDWPCLINPSEAIGGRSLRPSFVLGNSLPPRPLFPNGPPNAGAASGHQRALATRRPVPRLADTARKP